MIETQSGIIFKQVFDESVVDAAIPGNSVASAIGKAMKLTEEESTPENLFNMHESAGMNDRLVMASLAARNMNPAAALAFKAAYFAALAADSDELTAIAQIENDDIRGQRALQRATSTGEGTPGFVAGVSVNVVDLSMKVVEEAVSEIDGLARATGLSVRTLRRMQLAFSMLQDKHWEIYAKLRPSSGLN